LGNVADVIIARRDGTVQAGCAGSNTASVLPGGRNVVLDFSDTRIVQVMQGKLSGTSSAPISWLAFKTTNPDVRTCGFFVQPSNANALLTTYTAAAGKALSNLTLSCSTNVNPAQLLFLSGATFAATLPAVQRLNPVVPAYCNPVFTQPTPNISTTDGTSIRCQVWVVGSNIQQSANAVCPYAGSPQQWANSITKQQLPVARPPNWRYRASNTAIINNTYTGKTYKSVLGLPVPVHGEYITAKVRHAPITGVTAAMVYWWFNGNVDGEMVLNGAVWPRYQVWHPRDHVAQNTLLRGPIAGSATKAWWSIIEFVQAGNPTGYTKASTSWAKNYIVYSSIQVHKLTATSLDMRVTIDGAVPLRLLHTWADSADGLTMESTLYLGVQPDARADSPTDDPPKSLAMNPVAFKLFGGDCAKSASVAWTHHCVEEMGNFEFFLPELFNSA